jgi:8-oxo-dGTP pyrophosphatase MutT (NUDIX family)
MPLSFDPQTLPVLGVDDHLPAVDADVLRPERLRQRFLLPAPWPQESSSTLQSADSVLKKAAVLIALIMREEVTVLLTRRALRLTDHAGQISFPGGRVELHDADAAATALREAHEETGLAPSFAEVLGSMPEHHTGTGYVVTPVVALVRPGFVVQADAAEVDEVFEVPLAFLMNPAHHCHHAVQTELGRREFLSMPWQRQSAQGTPTHYFIWGATAAMLRSLYGVLTA